MACTAKRLSRARPAPRSARCTRGPPLTAHRASARSPTERPFARPRNGAVTRAGGRPRPRTPSRSYPSPRRSPCAPPPRPRCLLRVLPSQVRRLKVDVTRRAPPCTQVVAHERLGQGRVRDPLSSPVDARRRRAVAVQRQGGEQQRVSEQCKSIGLPPLLITRPPPTCTALLGDAGRRRPRGTPRPPRPRPRSGVLRISRFVCSDLLTSAPSSCPACPATCSPPRS